MFLCGDVSPEARRLCTVTKAALDAAIRECGPGVRFSRIGAVVSKLAKAEKWASFPRSENLMCLSQGSELSASRELTNRAIDTGLGVPAGPLHIICGGGFSTAQSGLAW